jgi:hypothetical protein
LEIAGLIVNGWQRIQRLQGNSLPSFGTQINYSPTEKITFNWSTFIGTDDPTQQDECVISTIFTDSFNSQTNSA